MLQYKHTFLLLSSLYLAESTRVSIIYHLPLSVVQGVKSGSFSQQRHWTWKKDALTGARLSTHMIIKTKTTLEYIKVTTQQSLRRHFSFVRSGHSLRSRRCENITIRVTAPLFVRAPRLFSVWWSLLVTCLCSTLHLTNRILLRLLIVKPWDELSSVSEAEEALLIFPIYFKWAAN